MGTAYLTYTLLMLTTFHNGDREMFFSPGWTQEVCESKALNDNMNWQLYGDHETFKVVKYICISSRKLP